MKAILCSLIVALCLISFTSAQQSNTFLIGDWFMAWQEQDMECCIPTLVEITDQTGINNVLNITYVFSNTTLALKACQVLKINSTQINGNIQYAGFSWQDPQLDLSFYNSYDGMIYLDYNHVCSFHLINSNYSDNASAYINSVSGTWGNAININGSYQGQPSNSCCIPQQAVITPYGSDIDLLNVTYTFTQTMLNTPWCQQLNKNTSWSDVLSTDWYGFTVNSTSWYGYDYHFTVNRTNNNGVYVYFKSPLMSNNDWCSFTFQSVGEIKEATVEVEPRTFMQ